MNNNLNGMIDDYSVKNATPEINKKHKNFIKTLSDINMTRDSMSIDEERNLFFINWSEVGCVVNEFLRYLMKHLKFDEAVEINIEKEKRYNKLHGIKKKKHPIAAEYQGYFSLIASHILIKLDENKHDPIGLLCALLMKAYFDKVEKKRYSYYFNDTE